MNLLIGNVTLLLGEDLQIVKSGWIRIVDGMIAYVGEDRPNRTETSVILNGRDLLVIPGLINAHTHIGDSVAQDAGVGSTLNQLVHPIYGLKNKLLNEVNEKQIKRAIAETTSDMLASGTTTFADFREGGLNGVLAVEECLRSRKQRALILGRPNYHFSENEVLEESRELPAAAMGELLQTIGVCSGIGLSGPNEYTRKAMEQISEVARSKGKLLAIHAAETPESRKFSLDHFAATEVERVLRCMEPDFVVHLTNSDEKELEMISKKRIPVVCCPRANSILGLGLPPILNLLQRGVKVALGTDNVMLNAPDMFREMDYTSKALRALSRDPAAISPKEILKMTTVNAAKALGLESNIGSIEIGKRADLVFLNLNASNLRFSRDLVASVVHRARSDNVACVMVDGEIVHGSLEE